MTLNCKQGLKTKNRVYETSPEVQDTPKTVFLGCYTGWLFRKKCKKHQENALHGALSFRLTWTLNCGCLSWESVTFQEVFKTSSVLWKIFNPQCIKRVPGDPKTIFWAISRKMLERSDFMYFSIFMVENGDVYIHKLVPDIFTWYQNISWVYQWLPR